MSDGQRYGFGDPWRNPEKMFPSFMAELRLRYPEYGLVWDFHREQWLCYHRFGPSSVMAVAYVEDADGVAMDPSMEFLDELSRTDVIRQFGDIKAYLAWSDKHQQEYDERVLAEMRADAEYAAKPMASMIERSPTSVTLRPLSVEHRRQVDRDLALSLNSARTVPSVETVQ